ncbi:hypothetical protein C2845_PM11G14320 [Panicum miliaceum]|uniref:Uncharacterized protein n=1 Tax=Panicum miliaceum TaxID=4540 RepID=A0A3L6RUM2_PANMI|nr:hypothetical protein C2845_PM11G14320 [Panicum miliaceum]
MQVFIPINIEKFHCYLAVVNAKKCEIHVLASMGLQIMDRKDLNTTDDMTNFRFKLPAILWDSRLNTKKGCQQPEETNEVTESPSDVEIIDAPNKVPKAPNASYQAELDAFPYALSTRVRSTNTQELLYVLSNYIMLMDNAEYLQ